MSSFLVEVGETLQASLKQKKNLVVKLLSVWDEFMSFVRNSYSVCHAPFLSRRFLPGESVSAAIQVWHIFSIHYAFTDRQLLRLKQDRCYVGCEMFGTQIDFISGKMSVVRLSTSCICIFHRSCSNTIGLVWNTWTGERWWSKTNIYS